MFHVPGQIHLDAKSQETFVGRWSSVNPIKFFVGRWSSIKPDKSFVGYCRESTMFPVWIKITKFRDIGQFLDGKVIEGKLFVTSGSNSVVVNMKLASDSNENESVKLLDTCNQSMMFSTNVSVFKGESSSQRREVFDSWIIGLSNRRNGAFDSDDDISSMEGKNIGYSHWSSKKREIHQIEEMEYSVPRMNGYSSCVNVFLIGLSNKLKKHS